jgi:hypothetical protein
MWRGRSVRRVDHDAQRGGSSIALASIVHSKTPVMARNYLFYIAPHIYYKTSLDGSR